MTSLWPRVHFIGVAGVGMSALAHLLFEMGSRVSGSDRHLDQAAQGLVFDRLRAGGITLTPQDGSGVTPDCSAVVASTAIEPGNPDLDAAARMGIPVRHRSELLQHLAEGRRSVAVTGTAGKTTVTAMLGWIFEAAGRDPTVVNGGALLDWVSGNRSGNARLGASDWFLFEADESDRSCLRYHPEWAALTNLSKDHFDLAETANVFRQFTRQVQQATLTCVPAEDRTDWERCETVAFETGDPRPERDGASFELASERFRIFLPGRHNAENALLAAATALKTGLTPSDIRSALTSFRGVARRLERVSGRNAPIAVFDDMAHNPAKIRAAWEAVTLNGGPVIGIWRPHGFAPLSQLFDDLASVFRDLLAAPGNRLYLLPVYYAGGTARGSRSSADLASLLQRDGYPVEAVEDGAALQSSIKKNAVTGSTILLMGARDPGLPTLASDIADSLSP